MDTGKLFKEIRKNENKTQEEFAKQLGISRSYLSDVENNRQNPSVKTVEKLLARTCYELKVVKRK